MRFRFRTCALIGRWHSCRAAARAEAIRLGQAEFDPGAGFEWKVPGEIESGASQSDWSPATDEVPPQPLQEWRKST